MEPEYFREKSSQNYKRKKQYSKLYLTQSEPGETFTQFVKRMKREEIEKSTTA